MHWLNDRDFTRSLDGRRAAEQQAAKLERGQRRAQKTLLSFGEDEEGDDGDADLGGPDLVAPAAARQAGAGMRSAHDVITDAR